jgi:hypothetical protein
MAHAQWKRTSAATRPEPQGEGRGDNSNSAAGMCSQATQTEDARRKSPAHDAADSAAALLRQVQDLLRRGREPSMAHNRSQGCLVHCMHIATPPGHWQDDLAREHKTWNQRFIAKP